MTQLLTMLPLIVPAVIAFNALLSALVVFLNKMADVMKKPENGTMVQMIGSVAAFLGKIADFAGMNIQHDTKK